MFSGYLVVPAWRVFRISHVGDDLQMWKAVGNIVRKTSRRDDIGCPGSGIGVELKTPHGEKVSILQNAIQVSERDEIYRILSFGI
jgi:hypothetical protein